MMLGLLLAAYPICGAGNLACSRLSGGSSFGLCCIVGQADSLPETRGVGFQACHVGFRADVQLRTERPA